MGATDVLRARGTLRAAHIAWLQAVALPTPTYPLRRCQDAFNISSLVSARALDSGAPSARARERRGRTATRYRKRSRKQACVCLDGRTGSLAKQDGCSLRGGNKFTRTRNRIAMFLAFRAPRVEVSASHAAGCCDKAARTHAVAQHIMIGHTCRFTSPASMSRGCMSATLTGNS